MKKGLKISLTLLLIAASLSLFSIASHATSTAGNGPWTDGGNWQNSNVPSNPSGNGVDIIIYDTILAELSYSLTGGGGPNRSTLTIEQGGFLTIDELILGNNTTTNINGKLVIEGDLTNNNTLNVGSTGILIVNGDFNNNSGTANVSNGGYIEFKGAVNNNSGNATITSTGTVKVSDPNAPIIGSGSVVMDVELDLKAFLSGAYDAANSEMQNSLYLGNLLPLSQPYNSSPWNYAGEEQLEYYSEFPSNAVDWVLLSFRTDTDINSTIYNMAALILQDGQISNPDGSPIVFDGVDISSDYYIVIYHRNHLAVMTSDDLNPQGGKFEWDFTTAATQAYGSNSLLEVESGIYGMHPGDINANGNAGTSNDRDIWRQQNGLYKYHSADINMDGNINAMDLKLLKQSNGLSTNVPD